MAHWLPTLLVLTIALKSKSAEFASTSLSEAYSDSLGFGTDLSTSILLPQDDAQQVGVVRHISPKS